MNSYTTPDLIHSALITIDTQNDFTLAGAPVQIPGTMDVLPNMIRLLKCYRQHSLPIIHVVRLYLPDGSNADLCRKEAIEQGAKIVQPGSNGAELADELKPASHIRLNAALLLKGEFQKIGSHEQIMYKSRWGAFYKTPLESFLSVLNVNTLVFCGCNYPNCPRTSIYEASERDFRIVLVKDAISQLYPKGAEEMKHIGVSLLTTGELTDRLSAELSQR